MRDAPIIGKLSLEKESSVQKSLCSPLERHGAAANMSIPRTDPLPARAALIAAIYLVLRLSALCSAAEPLPEGWWQQSAAEATLAKAESITDALLYFRGTKASLLNDPNTSIALFQRRNANDAIERKSVNYNGGKTLLTVYELESGKYFYARGRLIRSAFKDDPIEPSLAATLDHAYDYKWLPSETIGTNDCVVIARIATAQLIQMLRAAFYPGIPFRIESPEDPIKYITAERVTYIRKNDGVIIGEVEKNNRGEILEDTLYDVVVVNSPIPSEEFDLPKIPVLIATNTVQLMRMLSKGYVARTSGAKRIRVAIIGAMVISSVALLALLYFRMYRGNANLKEHATR